MKRTTAVAEHTALTTASRVGRACLRRDCAAPVTVRVLTARLDLYSACDEHGRDLWRAMDGTWLVRREAVAWWRL